MEIQQMIDTHGKEFDPFAIEQFMTLHRNFAVSLIHNARIIASRKNKSFVTAEHMMKAKIKTYNESASDGFKLFIGSIGGVIFGAGLSLFITEINNMNNTLPSHIHYISLSVVLIIVGLVINFFGVRK